MTPVPIESAIVHPSVTLQLEIWNTRAARVVCQDWGFSMSMNDFVEEIQVLGRDLADRVKTLIHEGNVTRIIIKDEKGNTYMEIPVTVAAVGVILVPVLAAVGAISALVAKFKIVIERAEPKQEEKTAAEKSN